MARLCKQINSNVTQAPLRLGLKAQVNEIKRKQEKECREIEIKSAIVTPFEIPFQIKILTEENSALCCCCFFSCGSAFLIYNLVFSGRYVVVVVVVAAVAKQEKPTPKSERRGKIKGKRSNGRSWMSCVTLNQNIFVFSFFPRHLAASREGV